MCISIFNQVFALDDRELIDYICTYFFVCFYGLHPYN
jgi:hypothetical protein